MRYCQYCGSSVEEEQEICLKCGRAIKGALQNKTANDTGDFGWGLLGFCIPLVGLILYLAWMNDRPNTAKVVGIGALISVGISVTMYLFFILIGLASV